MNVRLDVVLPDVRSVYGWEGKVDEGNEVVLIAKTRAELFGKLCDAVKALHSYACPCIVATPITDGYGPYLDWIGEETKL